MNDARTDVSGSTCSSAAPGSVEDMDEASERRDDAPASASHADAGEPSAIDAIEALPLAERAPRYQELADLLRSDLERSDPARGDA
ncbi:hypothetical protein ET445_14035 [Agromyces protaetiae]|uniref:Uncharacterized protein n=1 Tax=Agromyces protaetiae TaxID=2509455 RepID=A0A4V0YHD0_9MICO|nr:hypothetical protein [Agromyces protaetiae]QAY74281.1 hypothetical protein ET445_14035 [Agromyces protaetiae]